MAALASIPGDWLFNREFYDRKRERVVCLGDSHVKVMRHVVVPGFWFRTFFVDGATASGVTNPNSATRAMTFFTRRLQQARPWQRILVQLGEVDCGFVIWHRAERHGLTIEDQLERTLESYSSFIGQIIEFGFAEVVVLSAPAPTISDDPRQWGGVANLRSEVSASQRERTDLTMQFNEQMRLRCSEIGATFVDATTDHIDPKSALIATEFRRSTAEDHHLADEPYAALISRQLSRIWGYTG